MATLTAIYGKIPTTVLHGKLSNDLPAASLAGMTFQLKHDTVIPAGSMVRAERCLSPDVPGGMYQITVFGSEFEGRTFAVHESAVEEALATGLVPK